MADMVRPVRITGTESFSDVLSFHASADSSVFYQEYHVPFSVTLMSISPGKPESSVISCITPSSHFILPAVSVSGRVKSDQHQHNVFELTYVLEGSMYQIVEGKKYFYPTGSCCLMNRNTLHNEELGSEFTCVFITMSAEFIKNILVSSGNLLFPGERSLLSNPVFDFLMKNMVDSGKDTKDFLDFVPKITQTQQVRTVHSIFEELLQILIDPSAGASYSVYSLICRLFGVLGNGDCYNAAHVNAASAMDSIIFARIDQVLNQYHGRISHSELAALLNYNGSYLGRIVKKYTGQSLFDYSMTFTMAYAANQLANTDRSAAEIATELSFSNRTHFYKLFKEHFGVTPGEYRAELKSPRR